VLWLGMWADEGARAVPSSVSTHGAAGSCPHLHKSSLPGHPILSPQGPPAAGLCLGSQTPTPHWDTAMDHGPILPRPPGCCVPHGGSSHRQAPGSLAAALPALPAWLGRTRSVHPTKPSGEARWPLEKPLQEHLFPGSSQSIPHLPPLINFHTCCRVVGSRSSSASACSRPPAHPSCCPLNPLPAGAGLAPAHGADSSTPAWATPSLLPAGSQHAGGMDRAGQAPGDAAQMREEAGGNW